MDIFHCLAEVDLRDVYEHVYDIHVDHKPREDQHLGYVDKSTDTLHLSLPNSGDELTITQSRSSLSGKEALSTGFVCWQSVAFFADWILGDKKCPFYRYFHGEPELSVLEIGAGVSAVLASLLGPRSRQYVATDQKHILKLLKQNLLENVVSSKFTTSTLEWLQNGSAGWPQIEVTELDWEHPEPGIHEFKKLTKKEYPDLVIATDTIYNEYLVPFFVGTLAAVMGPSSGALVTMQLRDEAITASFVQEVATQRLRLRIVRDEYLPDALIRGFVVYYITK